MPIVPVTNYEIQAGVGSRLAFSRVRSTTFALGPQTGFDASVSLRVDHPAFGATYHNVTVSYAMDAYQGLWGVSPVIAMRLVGAIRTGDLVAPNGFESAGFRRRTWRCRSSTRRARRRRDISAATPSAASSATSITCSTSSIAEELWQIERGLGTLPIYIRRLHLGLLTDLATAFNDSFDPSKDVRWSVGAALRLDAFFGYFVPGTFEIGWARGLIQGGIDETWFLLTGKPMTRELAGDIAVQVTQQPLPRASARVARSARARRRSHRASRLDLVQADAVSMGDRCRRCARRSARRTSRRLICHAGSTSSSARWPPIRRTGSI